MAIPIISDLLDLIKKTVDWSLKVIPRPMLFLLFFSLLAIVGGFILPLFFNMTGTFCIDGDKYTNEFYDIGTNFFTVLKVMGLPNEINETLGTQSVESNCLKYAGNSTNSSRWYDGGYCTNCTRIDGIDPLLVEGVIGDNFGMCGTDAYRVADVNKSLLKRTFCESIGDETLLGFGCEPPLGYYYDLETVAYVCDVPSICENATEYSFLKLSLIDKGFDPIPAEIETNPPLAGVGCNNNKAKLQFIGIDVFDLRIWALLFLIILIWYAYRHIR